MNITGEQARAARCFMDWSRNELARAAKISAETIKNFETGVFSPHASTRAAIIETFETQGLEFVEGGVRRKAACVNCGYPNGFVVPTPLSVPPIIEAGGATT